MADAVCCISPLHECEEDLRLGADVLDGGRTGADLAPQDVVEDVGHVLLTLLETTIRFEIQ